MAPDATWMSPSRLPITVLTWMSLMPHKIVIPNGPDAASPGCEPSSRTWAATSPPVAATDAGASTSSSRMPDTELPKDPREATVLIVDDQELARAGIRRILSQARPTITIVGECADGDEVLGTLQQHPAQVVVMDLRMPRMAGADATRRVKTELGRPPAVLVLTTFG